jgi:transcriptional regulator with PAS, ATPase and Fis domain
MPKDSAVFLNPVKSFLVEKISITRILLLLAVLILIWAFEAAIHETAVPHSSLRAAVFGTSPHELYTRLVTCLAILFMILAYSRHKKIQEQRAQKESIFNNVIPICVTGLNHEIIRANKAYWHTWGKTGHRTIKCYEHRPGKYCQTEYCAVTRVANGDKKYTCESLKQDKDETKCFLVTATPYLNAERRMVGVIETFQDITAQKNLQHENEKLINDLQETLEKVKLLSGILPICASCKQIKTNQGVWRRVEDFIATHSEATFSHGICPDCTKKLYPGISLSMQKSQPILQNISHQDEEE